MDGSRLEGIVHINRFLLISTYRFAETQFQQSQWGGDPVQDGRCAYTLLRCDNTGATTSENDVGRIASAPDWTSQPNSRRCASFLEYVEAKGGAWITRPIDIARWWHEHHASFPV